MWFFLPLSLNDVTHKNWIKRDCLHGFIIIYTWSSPEILQFDQFINIFSVITFNRQIMYWSLLLYRSKLILSTLKLPQLLQTSLRHLIVVISWRHHMKTCEENHVWWSRWNQIYIKYFSLFFFSFFFFFWMHETWRQSHLTHEYSPGIGISV